MPNQEPNLRAEPDRERNTRQSKEFVRLLTANQHRVYAFILTLVPDWSAAEDILQDTTEVMWVKYPQVCPLDNFAAWAMRIAHNKVLNYLTKRGHQRIVFHTDLLDEMARQTEKACSEIDDRIAALKQCMSRLNQNDRRYLRLRYEDNLTIKQIAHEVGRPVHGMYKKMARIHGFLLHCIQRRLAGELG